jgi:phosphoribosyl 1,2-cyclic phosphate phosphodiesterase
VLYTHSHADHVHGIDDMRMIVFNMRARLPVWADLPTQAALRQRFGYVFETPPGSSYPPILDLHLIDGPVTISGAGGDLCFTPFAVRHGGMDALGFRFHDVAYLPDVASVPDDAWPHLADLRCWIVDALRRDPHPTHSHLDQTLGWIDTQRPRHAVLTNMHNDLDYDTVQAETKDWIEPAFDGMELEFDIS